MTVIYGPTGKVIDLSAQNKKAAPPKTGEAFGAWAGRDMEYVQLPGGGVVQFDLSQLRVEDFRQMRDHYQVNASLAVLSFMQHQSDFRVECEDKKIADFHNEMLHENWTMLNRAMSQSNWAGYSPNVLQWENKANRTVLDKIKDLVPEECEVQWKEVEGWAPPGRMGPKFKIYDGIRQIGQPYPIPVESSYWYPLLMENGDHSGRKLLRPAFQSYFFSILVHLFANRYFERFGEPTPVGRAPFEDVIDVDGSSVKGNVYMLEVLKQFRNHGVVVLPNDKTNTGQETNPDFDYMIEYLESQMRGADFERYLTRLDEEISIGLFTPILLLRTADVGSYNLGQGHMQMYLWMLNAMNDDRKMYIDKYILSRSTDINFGPNAPRPKIKFRKLGNSDATMVKELLTALTQRGSIDFDYEELGQIAGMTITQVRETTSPPPAPGDGKAEDPATGDGADDAPPASDRARIARATGGEIVGRVRSQVESAFRDGVFGAGLQVNMGYKRRMEKAMEAGGVVNPKASVDALYGFMDSWLEQVVEFGTDEFSDAENFVSLFASTLYKKIDACANL